MYVEQVLPHHRRFYDAFDPERRMNRSMHLCGDASRHLPTIRKELGVMSFDTGYPIDFARVRSELGPEVEISGGVEIGLLMYGTPEQVYRRSKEILTGGVLEGKRFVFREGNNLPPATPEANLEAMYRAALKFGGYS
jgi:uroporphyrinogen-III decarboxylase